MTYAPQHSRKIFIGGLDYDTTNDSLQSYFSQYGEVIDSIVMKDPATSRSRGFGFITYSETDVVDEVQKARPHKVDGKMVETKRAVPKADLSLSSWGCSSNAYGYCRIFVGGLGKDLSESDLEDYFKQFGEVASVTIMYQKSTGKHRGFGFVDFHDYDHVDKVLLTHTHKIKGNRLDVKKAIRKGEIDQMKTLISGVTKLEAAALAANGYGKLTKLVKAPTSGEDSETGLVTDPSVPGGDEVKDNEGSDSNSPRSIGFCVHGHPCIAGVPSRPMPGYSAKLPSGWQYSVSDNAEVLRNLALESDGDSDDSCKEDSSGAESAASKPKIPEDVFSPDAQILFVEPFFGGSHAQLLNTFINDSSLLPLEHYCLLTLPAKKWHWKARTSALYFCQKIPRPQSFKVLFASATLNLCELMALRPDLSTVRKVLYFHENQLVYPIRKQKNRDYQYGYNQILSCLVADKIIFNSQYNLDSFLREIPRFLKQQPGQRPDPAFILEDIKKKSKVIYFPVNIVHKSRPSKDAVEPLHIIWPHRWEHDKDPETFFQALFKLAEDGFNFQLSILGESYSEIPPIFHEAKKKLAKFIHQWGFIHDKDKYWELLHTGDVVISTAHHEFFGVSMLEAVGAGCIPLCPNRLVYPEIYSQDCLYNTTEQLQKTLGQWCTMPQLVRSRKVNLDLNTFSWQTLRAKFAELLDVDPE